MLAVSTVKRRATASDTVHRKKSEANSPSNNNVARINCTSRHITRDGTFSGQYYVLSCSVVIVVLKGRSVICLKYTHTHTPVVYYKTEKSQSLTIGTCVEKFIYRHVVCDPMLRQAVQSKSNHRRMRHSNSGRDTDTVTRNK